MRRCTRGVFLTKNKDFSVIKRAKAGYKACAVALRVLPGYSVALKRSVSKVEINLGIENKS